MAITVPSLTLYSMGANGGTSSPSVDLTGLGITNIVIVVAAYQAGVPTVADSPNNTLTPRTLQTSSEPYIRIYDVDSPTVTNNYTVTTTGISEFAAVAIFGLAGGAASSAFDQEDGNVNNNAGATSVQAATGFTPTNDGEIIISGLCYSLPNTPTIADGGNTWSTVQKKDYSASVNEGLAVSYSIQTSKAATQPTWSWSTPTRAVMTMISYKAAAGGGGTSGFLVNGGLLSTGFGLVAN